MLHVHRAADATALVDALAEVLAVPSVPDDPFAAEVVAVPSRGIERWLAQELSTRVAAAPDGRDGVCANVVFPFPAAVVSWGVRGGPDAPVDVHQRDDPHDPWAPARLTWTLLDVVEGTDDEGRPLLDGLGAFGAHLAGDRGRMRRLPALRHVADLFDRYGVHRPDMIRAWHAGDDVDATGAALDDTARWQPRLWRAARQRLGRSFPEQVSAAVARLRDGTPVPGLPPRLTLYGLTGLPASYAEVFESLGIGHDVHVFLLHPSPGLWRRVAPQVDATARPLRADDPTADLPRHPLVSSWGRDARELQVVLAGRGQDHPHDPPAPAPGPTATLLARLQHDLVTDTAPPGPPLGDALDLRVALEATTAPDAGGSRRAVDDSLQVHACHGRLRQVEVLRDAVFGLMSDHPDIQPRDVVVMCPDVEAFAPLVDAVFGADAHVGEVVTSEGPDAGALPDVRVRLADRALRQVNPVLRTMADVLHLPDSRVESTTVLDLAHRGPVRQRFGFSDDDLGTIQSWVEELRVRWGLDADHRRRHGLASDANTWRAGLDRLLLGVAVTEDGPRTSAGLVPHDDVEGGAVDLAGRLAELVERVAMVVEGLADPRPITDWCADLQRAAALLTRAAGDDEWQQVQFERLVDEVRDAAGGQDAPTVDVTLPEIRALLDDRLRGRPSRANHRTGDLTVCTLVPMRSVPYRVVCLLGLDDEAFPRRTVPSGDDLIARAPMVGDRDPRTEDRQLLLDALLAAGDHLVITYRARDERTDAPVPPAVPLAELLDVVDDMARPADGHGRARDLVVRSHPLRGADPREFDPADPFGFDPVALAGARARTHPLVPPPRFLDALPAAAPRPTVVEWADFVSFLDKPIRGYLRRRLGVSLRSADDPVDELLPVDLVALDEWSVGTRLLQGAMEGRLEDWLAAERSRGTLPVDQIGEHRIDEVLTDVRAVRDAAAGPYGERLRGPTRSVEVDLRVDDLHLVGVVPDVGADLLGRVDYGRPKPKRLLRLWLPWLAMQAMDLGREAVLVTRGKKPSSRQVATRELARLTTFPAEADPAVVTDHLRALADLYVRGHEAPLPVFEEATPEFASQLVQGRSRDQAIAKAADKWICDPPGRTPWGDGLDASVVQVFGRLAFPELLRIPPTEDEDGPGWVDDEPSRFGRLARRIWEPVLTTCESSGVTG